MSYMTMEEQVASHLMFLQGEGLAVEELMIDKGFIRCDMIGASADRGELCYQTKTSLLRNGLMGFGTWLRIRGGEVKIHKTYGYGSSGGLLDKNPVEIATVNGDMAYRKAKLFWQMWYV